MIKLNQGRISKRLFYPKLVTLLCFLFFAACSGKGQEDEKGSESNEDSRSIEIYVNPVNAKDSITEEDYLWDKFVAVRAPEEVLNDIDSVLSDSVKTMLVQTISSGGPYVEFTIILKDSMIQHLTLYEINNEISPDLERTIANQLIGHKPSYSFTSGNGGYDFVIDKRDLTISKQ